MQFDIDAILRISDNSFGQREILDAFCGGEIVVTGLVSEGASSWR